MPYRTFSDSTGTDWQVWDIVPQLKERRHGVDDRRVERAVISFADRRKMSEDRRLAHTRRAVLRGTYAKGWLCFDNGLEKRRLSPIPTDWTVCSDADLEIYARQAGRVATGSRPSVGDDLAATG